MAIIDSLYNPIEQKQKLNDWEYMLKDNRRFINMLGIINQEVMDEDLNYASLFFAIAGLFFKEIDLNKATDIARTLHQTKYNNNFPRLDISTFLPKIKRNDSIYDLTSGILERRLKNIYFIKSSENNK